ncbi:MAG: ornithine cyclodeaminase family protein [Maribacter sp.]|nr:ornithine cyclodeaminase family protein [Maribacter sp.]
MEKMVRIDDDFINASGDFHELINALKSGFASSDIITPQRYHDDFPNPEVGPDSTLLLMPAWNPGKEAGVKIATVSPENAQFGLPSVQGIYILLDARSGIVKATLEAKSLTAKRTAAASALASSYLSNPRSSSLLMLGTGALSTNLIRAHASVRPIKKVYVWGRNAEKAQKIASCLAKDSYQIEVVPSIEEKIADVDIISCATLSKTPLVLGKFLRPGQHIDLVGSYKRDMREADDETISKASVFVDTLQGALKESGDLVIPLRNGVLKVEDIQGDLFGLCSNAVKGRTADEEITVFKSVGHALEDLVAASYYYKKFMHGK